MLEEKEERERGGRRQQNNSSSGINEGQQKAQNLRLEQFHLHYTSRSVPRFVSLSKPPEFHFIQELRRQDKMSPGLVDGLVNVPVAADRQGRVKVLLGNTITLHFSVTFHKSNNVRKHWDSFFVVLKPV